MLDRKEPIIYCLFSFVIEYSISQHNIFFEWFTKYHSQIYEQVTGALERYFQPEGIYIYDYKKG